MTLHGRTLTVLAERHDGGFRLTSPAPGVFRPTLDSGASLAGGRVLGTLEILGRPCTLVVPDGVAGYVARLAPLAAVQYGDELAALVPGGNIDAMQPVEIQTQSTGLVFRAPTSGRFYGRPAPDKPTFVTAGDEIAPGATVCLLEVMKTFHRVHYSGDRARVREVLVREGDDVNAGDALLGLDPI